MLAPRHYEPPASYTATIAAEIVSPASPPVARFTNAQNVYVPASSSIGTSVHADTSLFDEPGEIMFAEVP